MLGYAGVVGALGATAALSGVTLGPDFWPAFGLASVVGAVTISLFRDRGRRIRRLTTQIAAHLAERADGGAVQTESNTLRCTVDGMPVTVVVDRAATHERIIVCRVAAHDDGEFSTLPAAVHGDQSGARVEPGQLVVERIGASLRAADGAALIDQALDAARRRHVDRAEAEAHLIEHALAGSLAAFDALRARAPDHARLPDVARALSREADPATRLVGARALGPGPLTFFIEDSSMPTELRAQAIESLTDRAELAWLLTRLERWLEAPALRVAAIRALGALGERPGGERAVAHLRALVPAADAAPGDPALMAVVARALAQHRDRGSTAPLMVLLDHPDAEVRSAALEALAVVGHAAALPRLGELERAGVAGAAPALARVRSRVQDMAGGGLSVARARARGQLALSTQAGAGSLSEADD